MWEMNLVMFFLCMMFGVALITCTCCLCMKLSDLKMQSYIIRTAEQKGVQVDLNILDPKYNEQSPEANNYCTIMVPDVGIIL